jgi:hypothetical protein
VSTVTVVATVETATTPQRVRLDVTDVGTPNLFATTVTRLNPDGRVVPVRTLDGNPLTLTTSGANRVGLLYDYEMPYGSPVTYSTQETPTSTSAEVTVDSSKAWLIHPGVPSLSMPITVSDWAARTRKVVRGVFQPMGRATAVVVADGTRKASEYTLTVLTQSQVELDNLAALTSDTSPLLLNVPAGKGWGTPTEYVSIGDIVETRSNRILVDPYRTWQLPCTVVARPAGGTQSARTYTDLLAYATYTDLANRYSDYFSLLAGP